MDLPWDKSSLDKKYIHQIHVVRMSFVFTNEEEDDFVTLSSNSNLASIFHDSTVQQSSSKSLVYTAPKQPSVQNTQSALQQQAIVAAAAVTGYKLANEKYEPLVGKVGLALLNEGEDKLSRLILYQNKQKPLASARITLEFILASQPDNFCTFYDDSRQNWAVLFDNKETLQKFLYEINNMKSKLRGQQENRPPIKVEGVSKDKVDSPLPGSTETPQRYQESANKTKLISRIAKLGQPILPLSGAIVADESDAEFPLVQSSPPEVEPEDCQTKSKKPIRLLPSSTKPIVQPTADYSSAINSMLFSSSHGIPLTGNQQAFPMMQFIPPAYTAGPQNNSYHFETMMSENRIHNSEVRMHLCRITDKLDSLLQKQSEVFESTKTVNNTTAEKQVDTLPIGLLQLKAESSEISSKLDRLMSEMLECKNKDVNSSKEEEIKQLLVNERNAWAENHNETVKTVHELKQENEQLLNEIKDQRVREKDLEEKIVRLQKENSELKQDAKSTLLAHEEASALQIKDKTEQLVASFEATCQKEKELAHQNRELHERYEKCESKCINLETCLSQALLVSEEKDRQLCEFQKQVEELQKEVFQARISLVEFSKTKPNKGNTFEEGSLDEQVKIIMNKVNKEILKHFKADENYAFATIKSTVSGVIRDVTLAILNKEETKTKLAPRKAEHVENVKAVAVEDRANITGKVMPEVYEATIVDENKNTKPFREVDNVVAESETKERSLSLLETLQSSLAAASLENEHVWKPDPPPPPLFDDFDNEDDWLN